MGNQSGFTLIESILSLMISSIVLSLCLGGMSILHQSKKLPSLTYDLDITYKQISSELMNAVNIEVETNCLTYQKNEQTYQFILDNQRLVKTDGYEIFLFGVEDVYFEMNDYIYLTITRNEKSERRIIGLHRLNYA